MNYAAPEYLVLLWLVPAVAAFLWWAWRAKQRLIAQFVQSRLLANLTVGVSKRRQKLRLALLVVAFGCAVFALARPQWGFEWIEAKQRGLDIVVAIDTSRSMLAEDINPNRLERAKLAAIDLMKLCKSDRFGLVAFAGSSFLQCPLTLDEEAFRQSVSAIDANIIPQGGTALAEAIHTALSAFKDASENYKVLVLFTDGEDNDAGALEAAKAAAKQGLRIFTIGVGSPEGELIRLPAGGGKTAFLRDADGNIVKTRLNETLLQQIAGTANGFYLQFRGGLNTIEMLHQRGLAPLPRTEVNSQMVRHYFERYYWPLALAITLLLLEMFLPDRKAAARTSAVLAPAKKEALAGVIVFLLLAVPMVASASTASALREYHDGKFHDSLREYQRLVEQKPGNARLHFNAGSAAYQAKRYEAALQGFYGAMASPDPKLKESAYYNLGNTYFRIGDQHDDDDEQKVQNWEQAIQHYDEALKRDPKDADAQFNRDLVKKKLEELKKEMEQEDQQDQDKLQPSEQAKKAKAQADEAVRRRGYRQALTIMEDQLRQDETTRFYADYMKRLREINGIEDTVKR